RRLRRGWKHRAPPCASPRHRSIPGSALRHWASGRGSIFGATSIATLIRQTSEVRVSRILGGLVWTRAWTKHHNVGCMASAAERRGRPTYGDGFARRKLRQKLTARRWKLITNSPGNRLPLRSRGRTSPSLKRRNRKPMLRRRWIFTSSIRNSRTYKNSTSSQTSLMGGKSEKNLRKAADIAIAVPKRGRQETPGDGEAGKPHTPAGNFEVRGPFPRQPRGAPAGMPAQILERRPDLIASERRFAAAFHR